MFPDSAMTTIDCGRTKATYIAVHALAPYAKQKIGEEFRGKLFGLHVDETTYNHKCRLEFWVNYFCEGARKLRCLETVELHAKLNIEEFLLDTSVKCLFRRKCH